MAPPNRGVSKAVLPPARAQNLTRSVPAPASTPVPSATIVAPHINSTSSINDHSTGSSSRSSITIPYPTASAGSLESRTNQLLRDPSLSYIGDFNPFVSDPNDYYSTSAATTTPAAVFPDYQASLSSFSSPVSPAQQQNNLYEPAHPGSLGPLFQGNQPSFQEGSMFTDSPNNSSYSSPHSQEQHGYNYADPFSASRYNTTTSSSYMYNPAEAAPTTGHSSMSSSDEMETDATNGNGPFLYTFSDMPLSSAPSPSPQPQDDDDYVPPAPQLGHPSSTKSPSSPFSPSAKIPASSKEKEQNKQKLYRNRKSEFTNRMRDELLAMNLLPHSRITHAPEIMSKTADTLRDYKELLLMIRDNVDGMPDNLASVPGAIRKLLNENNHIFNNTSKVPAAPRTVASQQHPKATDYRINVNTTSIQPLPFRATGTGRQHNTF